MLLHTAKHDGDIPLVVDMCGRFWMDRGIAEKFGPDWRERLEQGPITLRGRYKSCRTKYAWELRLEVCKGSGGGYVGVVVVM